MKKSRATRQGDKPVSRLSTRRKILRNYQLYLLLLPGLLLIFIFKYLPLPGLIIAFEDYYPWTGFFDSEWVGLKHFIHIFQSETFLRLLGNTLVLSLLNLIFVFPSAIILALLINELHNGIFKRTVQTVSYLPHFISWVVVAGMAYNFLATDTGILNNLLKHLGLDPVMWYADASKWRGILTVTSIWKTCGWGTIVYLAAITSINPGLYEAAVIDGASKFRQIWHITIPGMMPVISVTLILTIGKLIKDDFEQIYALVGNNNLLYETTDVLGTWIFRTSMINGEFSSAAALGLFQGIVSFIMVTGANMLAKRTENSSLW